VDLGRLIAPGRSVVAALLACGVAAACQTTPAPPPTHGSASPDEGRADRRALAQLSELLGDALPPPPSDDEVGIEEPGFQVTRAFVDGPPRLGGAATKLRATAWRERVHQLEVTFPQGCSPECARSLTATVERWVGPTQATVEGRVRFLSAQVDTVRVTLEVYPSRPSLTRILLVCVPLENLAQGRSALLPRVGETSTDEPARCRPLPP
jgi:hypothetical protein